MSPHQYTDRAKRSLPRALSKVARGLFVAAALSSGGCGDGSGNADGGAAGGGGAAPSSTTSTTIGGSTTTTSSTTTISTVCSCGGVVFPVRARLESAGRYGALQLEIDYSRAVGGFGGAADRVHCVRSSGLAESIVTFNDDELARTLRVGIIDLDGFDGAADLFECEFVATTVQPNVGDFSVTVIDSADPQFNKIPAELSLEVLGGFPIDTTTLPPTPTTTLIEENPPWEAIFELRSGGLYGSLQFDAVYPADIYVLGSGASARCDKSDDVDGTLVSINDDEPLSRLRFGMIAFEGIEGPAELMRCLVSSPRQPLAEDFAVDIVDAADPLLNPVTADVSVRIRDPFGAPTTTVPIASTTTITLPPVEFPATTTHVVSFHLGSRAILGSLQFDVDYASAPAGAFSTFAGDEIECEPRIRKTGTLAAARDVPADRRASFGLIRALGFSGPGPLLDCPFELPGGGVLAPEDFTITVTESLDRLGVPVGAEVEVSGVTQLGVTTTLGPVTTTLPTVTLPPVSTTLPPVTLPPASTTTTTLPNDGPVCDVLVVLSADEPIGALQLDIGFEDLKPASFSGSGGDVDCDSLWPAADFAAFNEVESDGVLRVAWNDFGGRDGEFSILSCRFATNGTGFPAASDFDVEVVAVSGPLAEPATADVELTVGSCEGDMFLRYRR